MTKRQLHQIAHLRCVDVMKSLRFLIGHHDPAFGSSGRFRTGRWEFTR